jgi:predicted tellurium resistance membrane protein TerC
MDGESLVALAALTAMEIVLGIDNVVFLAIVTARLPQAQQALARQIGLGLALFMRIGLLLFIKRIMQLDDPIFQLSDVGFPSYLIEKLEHPEAVDGVSAKDLILFLGGLFLIAKSVKEMHTKLENHSEHDAGPEGTSFAGAILQIVVLDLIFSLDSVITAVGMAQQLWVMITSIVIAIFVMLAFANPISNFVAKHPTLTMLALSFLILIGVVLVAEGIGTHIDKKYIYFAMAFAFGVEMLNLRVRPRAHDPVGGPGKRPQ